VLNASGQDGPNPLLQKKAVTDLHECLGAAIREAETVGFAWAVEDSKSSSKHVPKENRRTAIGPHAAGAVRLLLFTGCRLREILHLKWEQVDFERGLLSFCA
jgi:integrase